jgi:hypothetical protein
MAVVAALAVSGCTPAPVPSAVPASSSPATAQNSESPRRTACETTALTLTVTPTNPSAGETVHVATAPEHCLVSAEWEGRVIVRQENAPVDTNPDTPTGTRIETGTSQPVAVKIPGGLEGDVFIMLEPDRSCEDLGDCYFPFAEITIEAPGG